MHRPTGEPKPKSEKEWQEITELAAEHRGQKRKTGRSKSLATTTPGSGKKNSIKTQSKSRINGDPGENFIRLKWPGIEPHGFSVKRFLRELEKPNLIILDALEYGRRLVADEEFVKIVEDRFEKVKRRFGLRWVNGTWTWMAERGGGRRKN